jgi:sugar phosphate isomerase/epimerase
MKIGIDSYCYHRFFGEVYPQQTDPGRSMTIEQFLGRAHELGVDGVSLESCFLPRLDAEHLKDLRQMLDEYNFDRVYAWGHPDGLEGGSNRDAYREMVDSFENASRIGAKVMRVVGSSLRFRDQPHEPQLERLRTMFREAVKVAEDHGIKMAVENHIDFTSTEMLELLDEVGSPYLGINFDSGNFLRMLDDPIQAMGKLASHVYAAHIKDLKVQRGVPANEWYFFSSTPLGEGTVDHSKLIAKLEETDFDGLLAVEIDFLHPDYKDDEDAAVAQSVRELRRLTDRSNGLPSTESTQ